MDSYERFGNVGSGSLIPEYEILVRGLSYGSVDGHTRTTAVPAANELKDTPLSEASGK